MRIGIYPSGNRHAGGIYQYSVTMLEALYQHKAEGSEDDFIVFAAGGSPFDLMSLNGRRWSAALTQPVSQTQRILGALRHKVGEGPHREVWRWFRKATDREKSRTRRNQADQRLLCEQFRAQGV